MRRPSREMAERLAQVLEIAQGEQHAFIAAARGERSPARLGTTPQMTQPPEADDKPIVPSLSTPLVGRTAELARLRALLLDEPARLVTLTALGGMGKTHLALAAAHALADRFADGVFFIPLDAVTEPAQLPGAIARGVELHDAGASGATERLALQLRNARVLIVLDRFEHLFEGAGQLSQLLLHTTRPLSRVARLPSCGSQATKRCHTLRALPLPQLGWFFGLQLV